jgi:hypothetical protein
VAGWRRLDEPLLFDASRARTSAGREGRAALVGHGTAGATPPTRLPVVATGRKCLHRSQACTCTRPLRRRRPTVQMKQCSWPDTLILTRSSRECSHEVSHTFAPEPSTPKSSGPEGRQPTLLNLLCVSVTSSVPLPALDSARLDPCWAGRRPCGAGDAEAVARPADLATLATTPGFFSPQTHSYSPFRSTSTTTNTTLCTGAGRPVQSPAAHPAYQIKEAHGVLGVDPAEAEPEPAPARLRRRTRKYRSQSPPGGVLSGVPRGVTGSAQPSGLPPSSTTPALRTKAGGGRTPKGAVRQRVSWQVSEAQHSGRNGLETVL